MSIHERIEALADLAAAGGLSEKEQAELAAHAAECASCVALLADAESFSRFMRGTLSPDAPPGDLEDRLVERFRAATAPKRPLRLPIPRRGLKLVASLAAVVLLVLLGNAFSESGFPAPSASRVTVGMDLREVEGETSTTRLGGRAYGGKGFRGAYEAPAASPAPPAVPPKPSAPPSPPPMAARPAPGRMAEERLDKNASDRGEFGGARADAPPAKMEPKPEPDPVKKFQEGRKIIRNADLSLEVEAYEAAYTKVAEIVAAEKGFVAGADTQKLPNGKMRAVVTVRVPPERFEATLARLRELGTVRNQSITTQDVTKQYVDLQARLGAKEALVERLKKVLAEAKGTVKELMEVEVQMGKTLEEIESIKGELKYYDNLIGLSTIILRISEKDLGLPFEYVETLQSTIGLTVREVEPVYAQAQKTIVEAGGQVVDSRMNRQSDGSAQGTIRGRVDAEKFRAVREALRKLGHVTADTVTQQRVARGGTAGAPGAPIKKEQAVIDLTISTAAEHMARWAQLVVETARVEEAYTTARRLVEEAGGKIKSGKLDDTAGRASAQLQAEVDAEKFAGLFERLKQGNVKHATTQHFLPSDPTVPVREKARIDLSIVSPPELIGEDEGLMRTIRDTFAGSIKGVLWSVEKLFVGISLAGPWIALALLLWLLYRRVRRKKSPLAPEPPKA